VASEQYTSHTFNEDLVVSVHWVDCVRPRLQS
jgi:hypothetical protein